MRDRGVNARLAQCLNSVLNVKALVGAFNQEKARVGAFSVITNLRMQFGCNFLKHYYRSSPQKLRPPRQKGGGGGGGEVRAKPSSDFTVDIFTAKTTEERDKERSEAEQDQDQQVGTVLTSAN